MEWICPLLPVLFLSTTEEVAVLLIFPCRRAGGNDFKLKEGILNVRKVFFYKEGGKTLELFAERDDPNSGNIPGQVGALNNLI